MATLGIQTTTQAVCGVRFYKIYSGGLRKKDTFDVLLNDLTLGKSFPHILPEFKIDKDFFQVRELHKNGKSWHGCFGKLRKEAPHIVNGVTGVESSIALGKDDKILEKSYFLYNENENVLLWQVNNQAGGIANFKEYLKMVSSQYVRIEHILDQAQLSSLLQGEVKEIIFHVSSLSATSLQQLGWTNDAMRFLQASGAASTKFEIKAPAAGKLKDRVVKPLVRKLATFGHKGQRLKVKVDSMADPVDIFMNTLKDSISYSKNGHYPDPVSIISQMQLCYQRNKRKI